ncbi:MAG: hypothetical protein JWP87_1782, partial [Labilithrix sp.]|nr:hypothetical protein [Labilithrix sp.]
PPNGAVPPPPSLAQLAVAAPSGAAVAVPTPVPVSDAAVSQQRLIAPSTADERATGT